MKSKDNLVARARRLKRLVERLAPSINMTMSYYVNFVRHYQSRSYNRIPRALKRP